MLNREDNELLTRTGRGTPMGELLRHYWMPVVLSSEIAPGGRVKRVQLLTERLIVYRTPSGQPGIVAEFCPHRSASLYYGRVEADGIRCVYHGWKFGLDGQCLEQPGEPRESSFAAKVCTPAYPCVDTGGVIWAYMGPGSAPAVPELEWTLLPEDHVFASKRVQDCNWFQAMEGGIDSSHIGFLHAPLDPNDRQVAQELDKASFGVGLAVLTGDRAPRFDVRDTDYGVLIGARRTQPNGRGAHVCDYAPPTSEPYGDIRTAANRDNDYFMDWEAHRTRMFCGIPGFGVQDQAIQESQGPIVDRGQERLGSSDTAIIQVRKRLMSAARALRERGTSPPGLDPKSYCVRSASALLPADADWVEGARPAILARPDQPLTLVS